MVYEVVELDLNHCREASGALLSQLHTPEVNAKIDSGGKELETRKTESIYEPNLASLLEPTGRELAVRRTIDRSLNEWEAFVRDEYGLSASPNASDPEAIDRHLQAMEDLQTAMVQAIAARTTALRRLRNQSPLIHLIPPELFIYILLLTVNFHEDSDDVFTTLRTLCLVCRYWRSTVLACSLFWPKICSVSKVEFRDIILRRNPYGALQILCKEGSLNEASLDAFLALSAKHSYRWQALTFQGPLSDRLIKHLEAPAPALVDLFMDQRSGSLGQKQVKLSDGCHLRHVDLDGVTLPWDLPRLTGLRSLQIRNIKNDLPSVERLGAMLSGSPELWWLLLADFEATTPEPQPEDATTSTTAAPTAPVQPAIVKLSPIVLPNLATLVLQALPDNMTSPLLSSIVADKLEKLVATEVSTRPISQDGSGFYDLVNTVVAPMKHVEITYNERSSEFMIASERVVDVPNEWIHHIDECPGLLVRAKILPSRPTWDTVSKFIAKLPIPSSDNTLVLQDHSEATPFPVQAVNEWDFITEVEISPLHDPRALFNHLALPQTVYPSGQQKWPLPNLVQVYSRRNEADTQEMKESLVNFLRRSNVPKLSENESAVPEGTESQKSPTSKSVNEETESSVVISRPKQLQKLKVHSSIVESLKEDPTLTGIEISPT
ncbi:hypothetical protein FRB90_005011 [Tulasnella sp. 427]|nr:hypothetical protein FRB90_005011 [Tulasnella sp. 427]